MEKEKKMNKGAELRYRLMMIEETVNEIADGMEAIKETIRGDNLFCLRMTPTLSFEEIQEGRLDQLLNEFDSHGGVWIGNWMTGYYNERRVFTCNGERLLFGPIYLVNYHNIPGDIVDVMKDVAILSSRVREVDVDGMKIKAICLDEGRENV